MDVAIFSAKWLDEHRGHASRLLFLVVTLLDNIAAHLRPSYLFFSGDTNRRHSSQIVGQLSPLDTLALVLATATALKLGRGGGTADAGRRRAVCNPGDVAAGRR